MADYISTLGRGSTTLPTLDTSDFSPPASGGSASSGSMGTGGMIMMAAGAVNSAIGAYYAAESAKYQLKSQSLTMQYQKDIADINMGIAEQNAQQALLAGQRQAGTLSMQYGQKKSSARASMAARGVTLGQGSAQEIIATTDLMKETDMLTINANAVRAAESARMQKASYAGESLMSGTASSIYAGQAGTINSGANAVSSIVSSGSSVASSWYKYFG